MVSIDNPLTEIALTDEATAKVAGAGTGKQGPNRLETDWSAKDVPRMAAEIERISGTWADRSHAVKVLRAICDLAAKDPDRLDPNRVCSVWCG
jgi:hypothetical protein